MNVKIEDLKIDNEIQQRVEMASWKVREYAEAMQRGNRFPSIVVFNDGETYWLADGFHRVAAAKKIGRETLEAEIKEGGKRNALLFAVGANSTHGLSRNREDVKKAILTMLDDPEWSTWPNTKIAEHVGVSEGTIRYWRKKVSTEEVEIVHPTKYDGPPSEFFAKMYGLYSRREGKPLTDWGADNGKKGKMALRTVLKNHFRGLATECGKDKRGYAYFKVQYAKYNFENKKKVEDYETILEMKFVEDELKIVFHTPKLMPHIILVQEDEKSDS